jgi:hypothetical protein
MLQCKHPLLTLLAVAAVLTVDVVKAVVLLIVLSECSSTTNIHIDEEPVGLCDAWQFF